MKEGEAAAKAWVKVALEKVREEVDCAISHLDETEEGAYASIALHMGGVGFGANTIGQTIVEKILSEDELIALLQQKMTEAFGQEAEFVGNMGGMIGFHLKPIIVPDDLSGLEEEGE